MTSPKEIKPQWEKDLSKFTQCEHVAENVINPDCPACNMAWAIERIKILESRSPLSVVTVAEIEKVIEDVHYKAFGTGINFGKLHKLMAAAIHALQLPKGEIPLVEEINACLLENAHGCLNINVHYGKGKIEKGCTMCWAEVLHALIEGKKVR